MKWDKSNQRKFFLKGNSGGNGPGRTDWIAVRPDAGGSIRAIFYRPGDIAIQTGPGWNDDIWHHVLIRVDTNTGDAQIIIDNVVQASTTGVTGTLNSPINYIQMMQPDSLFDNYIITKGYDNPTDFADFSGSTPCPIDPQVPTFIHYDADVVDANTYPTVPDISGNGNDAEFYNSTFAKSISSIVPC